MVEGRSFNSKNCHPTSENPAAFPTSIRTFPAKICSKAWHKVQHEMPRAHLLFLWPLAKWATVIITQSNNLEGCLKIRWPLTTRCFFQQFSVLVRKPMWFLDGSLIFRHPTLHINSCLESLKANHLQPLVGIQKFVTSRAIKVNKTHAWFSRLESSAPKRNFKICAVNTSMKNTHHCSQRKQVLFIPSTTDFLFQTISESKF